MGEAARPAAGAPTASTATRGSPTTRRASSIPQAAQWFREAEGAPLSEAQRAWRVRAALRAGAWPDVLAAIDAMPPAEAQDPAWRYWKARALSAAGRSAEASAIYAALAGEFSFYGLLAAEALGKRVEPASTPLAARRRGAGRVRRARRGARAVKLAQLDMRAESQREWIYVVRGLPDEGLLLAADYARRQGLYDRAINTAERTSARHDFGLRYLMPFREQFAAAAREQAVDEALLFGIARQESRFVPDIVSSAGAIGLMQLMPPTARWVAKQLNRADYRPSQIADVAINTQFGAFYFKYWLDRLERHAGARGGRVQCGARPRAGLAQRRAARGRDLGRDDPVQRDARLREEGARQRDVLRARSSSSPTCRWRARLGTVPPRGNGADARGRGGRRLTDRGTRSMADRTILVVGGSGFVGRHVVGRLAADGCASSSRRAAATTRGTSSCCRPSTSSRPTSTSPRSSRGSRAAPPRSINLVGILNETGRADVRARARRAAAERHRRVQGRGRPPASCR